MRKTLIGFTLIALAGAVHLGNASAADAAAAPADGCIVKADAKKLAGAARNSFVKKCQRDSGAAPAGGPGVQCQSAADTKKLHGAARNSFVKKCVSDGGPK
ncbi:hypothetical protein [Cognatazoarcus halotolerans]|uniref:hypothetical protein n=1 Tax=Cognatazoarcus halotolerans TaxID=2686016 RepID=UPI001356F0EB|nr:hypothetical protein [Cognatazoarcus halotolerans]